MAHLQRMAQLASADRIRQQVQEGLEVVELSNRLVGMNCHRIGPSLPPSSQSPLPTNLETDSPASASSLRLVQKRSALTANTKSSGVSAAHLA